jgi:long-subunit fatty acid transport protein
MPDVVRLGVEYAHLNDEGRNLFDIELDWVWENWSVTDAFRVTVPGQVSDVTGTLDERNIPNLTLGRHYNASWSLRLGAELNMLRKESGDGPVIRFGGFYETPSVDEEWTNLDFTPFERIAGTLGFSYHIKRWSIDLAYAYIWSPDRTVAVGEGNYDVLTPLWVCEDPSNANYPEECAGLVGNTQTGHAANEGTYTTWTQTFSLGGTYGW